MPVTPRAPLLPLLLPPLKEPEGTMVEDELVDVPVGVVLLMVELELEVEREEEPELRARWVRFI
jgi:hypothetical protein